MKTPIHASMLGVARSAPGIDFTKLDINKLKAERDKIIARMESKNPPITCVIPVPRVIPLGGKDRVCHELRIRDLASMQVWLEEQVPHPLAQIPPAWADPEPETRRRRLADAWKKSATWPPRYGTPEASRLLATAAGQAYFLLLVLRDDRVGLVEVLELLDRVSPIEWAGVRRVAYGLTPREEIADELAPDDRPSNVANWALSAYRACQHGGGPTFDRIGDWTISQWRLFCGEGRAGEFSKDFSEQANRVNKLIEGMGEDGGR